jgi:hypothetical protein
MVGQPRRPPAGAPLDDGAVKLIAGGAPLQWRVFLFGESVNA